jgi:hypothetical protein
MDNMNTPKNDEENDRLLIFRLANDIAAGEVDADVAQIVKDGKFTRAQVDEALELADEKLRLFLRFCEVSAQLWDRWVEREQAKGRPERELTFGEFLGNGCLLRDWLRMIEPMSARRNRAKQDHALWR